MSHGFDAASGDPSGAPEASPGDSWLARAERLLRGLNQLLLLPCMLALLGAAGILTYSVFARYFFHISTDWQDEVAVFLLVGATFVSSPYVQAQRGHIGIDALAGLLPERVNFWRRMLVDLLVCFFCAFFAWKSWTLFHEAWRDGQTTTSSWGPPLWIPYATMACGMSLVALQSLLQFLSRAIPSATPR